MRRLVVVSHLPLTSHRIPTSISSRLRTALWDVTKFEAQLNDFTERTRSEKIVLACFYTKWCKQCVRFADSLERLRAAHEANVETTTPSCRLQCSLPSPSTHVPNHDPLEGLEGEKQQTSFSFFPAKPAIFTALKQIIALNICVVLIDAEESLVLSALHDVRSVPTLVAYREGHVVGRAEGLDGDKLEELIRVALGSN
ncbi:putative thioredoxin [Trypanosoma vivax]|nr:putative thioredoxin [Trypanosoma vivax]